jgi:hypothetical protein
MSNCVHFESIPKTVERVKKNYRKERKVFLLLSFYKRHPETSGRKALCTWIVETQLNLSELCEKTLRSLR